ncbi:hypothetical protein OOK60_11595 [Trichothermofontia sichuanensis B231]|uniref:hypothetical protein n=1 Tax=Trichothermofontia sichuanensis TaxID=3045816 RepID=UPI0022469BDB|nr:hypothetical protein [Trichothermofontia sichuanensis]UZQ53157.1 hypothetical protein OOK60_11595 [Trichothermofontia sichuanensis B231]
MNQSGLAELLLIIAQFGLEHKRLISRSEIEGIVQVAFRRRSPDSGNLIYYSLYLNHKVPFYLGKLGAAHG